MALATRRSLCPLPYLSAVSSNVTPRSSAVRIVCREAASSRPACDMLMQPSPMRGNAGPSDPSRTSNLQFVDAIGIPHPRRAHSSHTSQELPASCPAPGKADPCLRLSTASVRYVACPAGSGDTRRRGELSMSTAAESVPELGAGIYSFPAAARLVGERPRKLHYWMESGLTPPSYKQARGQSDVLSFHDLLSLEMVKRIRNYGVT